MSAPLKPICVPCQRFFRCTKTGVYFTEGQPKQNGAPPGTQAPEQWEPYKVWAGDEFTCQGCGAKVIVGFSQRPLTEHYEADFDKIQQRLGADKYQVNDC